MAHLFIIFFAACVNILYDSAKGGDTRPYIGIDAPTTLINFYPIRLVTACVIVTLLHVTTGG